MPRKGYKQTAEHRLRIIEGHKEYWDSIRGKSLPAEWCKHISEGLKRFYSNHKIMNLGKLHSLETKKKISDTCKRNGVGKWNAGRRKSFSEEKKG